MYCAIIGDMVESRKNNSRLELQNKLDMILKEINGRYANSLSALFTITIGDEFQGLFNSVEDLVNVIDYIKFAMEPQKIRFGIGFGSIDTKIDSNRALGADGPAYHNAREALNEIKRTESKYEQPLRDVMVVWDSDDIATMDIINASLSTCALLENNWTHKQREVIGLLNLGEVTQSDIASSLNIEQTSVHRRLKAANFYTYKHTKTAIDKMLKSIWRKISDE